MQRQIYVNLPVKDLQRSTDFFTQLGFSFNSEYTDDNAACLEIADNIFAMLLKIEFFQTFTRKNICDATQSTEVLLCISCERRDEVDSLVEKARHAGGRVEREPKDHGFMYEHGFEDPDGHLWELVYMPPAANPADF